jgi:hypothetical protein
MRNLTVQNQGLQTLLSCLTSYSLRYAHPKLPILGFCCSMGTHPIGASAEAGTCTQYIYGKYFKWPANTVDRTSRRLTLFYEAVHQELLESKSPLLKVGAVCTRSQQSLADIKGMTAKRRGASMLQ